MVRIYEVSGYVRTYVRTYIRTYAGTIIVNSVWFDLVLSIIDILNHINLADVNSWMRL